MGARGPCIVGGGGAGVLVLAWVPLRGVDLVHLDILIWMLNERGDRWAVNGGWCVLVSPFGSVAPLVDVSRVVKKRKERN